MSFWRWSVTASQNDVADPTVNVREGWAPSIVNNSVRALMAALAKARNDWSGNIETTGTLTDYAITSNQGLASLVDGFRITARVHVTNGEDAALSVDSLTAKPIQSTYGIGIPEGALTGGSIYTFVYDSSADAWIVHGRFGDMFTAGTAPNLGAIEALSGTGVLRRVDDSDWALDADVSDLADTTPNRLFGTNGDGESGLVSLSGLALSDAELSLNIAALDPTSNPHSDNDSFVIHHASEGEARKIPLGLSPGALIAIIEDNKSQGTSANSLTANVDNVRTLNTLVFNRSDIVSLASNRFTLPVGTWEISWEAPIHFPNVTRSHQSFLYNQTDGAQVKRGTGGHYSDGDGGDGATLVSTGSAIVTLASSKAFEIRHRVNGTATTQGIAVNMGTEVFTRVVIRRA